MVSGSILLVCKCEYVGCFCRGYFFIDNLKYQIKENNEVAFMGVGRNVIKKEVVIPDAVSYGNVVYPVTSILEGYFGDVEKVVFGKNIKEVGSYAFSFSGKGW